MTKLLSRVLPILLAAFPLSAASAADIPIAYLSWDVTAPGASGQFDISGQTAPNSSISPDATWPVSTTVNLSSLSLRVDFSDGSSQILGPSYFSPSADGISLNGSAIPIGPSDPLPVDATLTGNLSPTTLTLNAGSNVTVSKFFSATIPGISSALVDGNLAVISAVPTGAMATSPPPATTVAPPGSKVNEPPFKLQNNPGGRTLVVPVVMISFSNADLFSSSTLTATVGPNTSIARINPTVGGNSPEHSNNVKFTLQPALLIPPGETATFSLAVTVVANPQITKRAEPYMYAAMVFGGSTGFNVFLVACALLQISAAGISATKRWLALAALFLFFTLGSLVGCDSSGSGTGTGSGVAQSKQTVMSFSAQTQVNNETVVIGGLPVVIGTVSVP